MQLVPLIIKGKREYHKAQVDRGDEGTMLKLASGTYEAVSASSRPDVMYKNKRREDIDAFVTGFDPGDAKAGWDGLIGNLRLSCYTETGSKHEVAYPANLTMEDRIAASSCALCQNPLTVETDNVEGKRVVKSIRCVHCNKNRPPVTLTASWFNKVFEVVGQEYTSRVWRLKHAFIDHERVGADGKSPEECIINLADIQARFNRLQHADDL
jgi:hypothetical protein